MTIILTQKQVSAVRRRVDRDIAASVAESIADSGARAWQRGAPMWDHGFVEHEHFAAAWVRGWMRAFTEFSVGASHTAEMGG